MSRFDRGASVANNRTSATAGSGRRLLGVWTQCAPARAADGASIVCEYKRQSPDPSGPVSERVPAPPFGSGVCQFRTLLGRRFGSYGRGKVSPPWAKCARHVAPAHHPVALPRPCNASERTLSRFAEVLRQGGCRGESVAAGINPPGGLLCSNTTCSNGRERDPTATRRVRSAARCRCSCCSRSRVAGLTRSSRIDARANQKRRGRWLRPAATFGASSSS